MKALGAQALDDSSVAFERPNADGLTRARMEENFAIRPSGWQPQLFARRKLKSKRVAHHAPVFITMRPRFGCLQTFRKEKLAAQPWKAEPRLHAKKPQQ